jgi:hypothetical protein
VLKSKMRPSGIIKAFLFFIVVISLAGQGFSHINSSALKAIDHLIDGFIDKKTASLALDFKGLSFTIDSNTNCEESEGMLNCRIIGKSNRVLATIQFEHKNLLKTALPLIGFMRKQEWLKQNPTNNRIVEDDYRVGVFQTRLQQYIDFRLDSTFRPVLIRAFDIVVDDKSIISVTTICDDNDWLMIQKAIESIELSFSITAKKSLL